MDAVADSNLAKMASLWGTASGPASKTNQPPDWQRRVAVMQAYLHNSSFRVTGDTPATGQTSHDVQVEIKRQTPEIPPDCPVDHAVRRLPPPLQPR